MAAQANITVFDGASTPVSHTLVADGVRQSGNVVTASWKETLAGVPDYAQIRFWMIRETLKSGVVKTTSRLDLPVMESVSGVNASGYTAPPKVANVERFEKVTYAHPRSIETNRRIAAQLLLNIENNVFTTVTPVSSGIVPDLNQRLITVG